jgi:endonuclease YncB( thermonuclease family)
MWHSVALSPDELRCALHLGEVILILRYITVSSDASSSIDLPVSVWADSSCPVVSILESDTIDVIHNHHRERIRLSGIGCPEKGRAYGREQRTAD